jgi:hypothetical protein
MREWCARLLESRTGQGVTAWNERTAAGTPQNRADEPALRKWLSAGGVTGYAQAPLVREASGYPGFLAADAGELTGRQYADRPQLRPVFDAVLRTLPPLPGPATVRARGTLVSLVSPRRTFAVLKPTTKSRVDLGLRLGTTQPEGRIQQARDLGQATVRIPLTTPGEVDDNENTTPPTGKPRPPARPKPVPGTMTVACFPGAKLRLVDVPPDLITEAMHPGHRPAAMPSSASSARSRQSRTTNGPNPAGIWAPRFSPRAVSGRGAGRRNVTDVTRLAVEAIPA